MPLSAGSQEIGAGPGPPERLTWSRETAGT